MGPPDGRAKVVALRAPGEQSDAMLVLAARDGERWAREALFRRHVKRMLGLAWRIIPEEDPEDVVQDAFIRAFDQLGSLKQPSAFGAWLGASVIALARMKLRKRRWLSRLGLARETEFDPETIVSSDAPTELHVELTDLYRRLGRLDPEQRIALLLQRVEGLELEEIATQMELSLSTVKRRIAEAHARLTGVADE